MSVKYIATKTQLFAGRGNESHTYELVEGSEVPAEMIVCNPTLLSALQSGSVKKVAEVEKRAPETKVHEAQVVHEVKEPKSTKHK